MLPDRWIERIFDRMAGLYGSKFADLWSGTDPQTVRQVWAEKLADFADKPLAIRQSLDALDAHPFPPTLPEFLTLCRDSAKRCYQPQSRTSDYPLLGYTATDEDIAEAKRRMKRMDLTADRDPLDWARRPVSAIAARAVIETAQRDHRFRAIVADLQAEGVLDESGHVVKLWDRSLKQFVPFGGPR